VEAWYVAKTKPRKERLVENYLTRGQGVEVFLPYIRRPAGKKGGLELLFPTYIFCLVDPQSADWGAIRWAPGVSYFLGAGHELTPVSDEIITHLKYKVSWWNNGGCTPSFAFGDRITITNGPFSGLEAIFQRYIPARQRCQVLIEILGQFAKAEVPIENVRNRLPYQRLVYAT